MRHWTPEEKQRQAELIRQWQPWRRSTGPKTEAGKAVSAKNAQVHGYRSEKWLTPMSKLRQELKRLKEQAKQIRIWNQD